MAIVKLDRVDTAILDLLQQDATIPLRELATRVHVSAATVQRRVADLRASGVLRKEVALVDRTLVGRGLTAFVSVELEVQNSAMLGAFEQLMRHEDDVLECYEIAGEFDFLLVVSMASMEGYHALTRRVFTSQNNVRNFKSLFAMNCGKFETRIPLPEPE
ncbi:MAG TPA: Lrp/AsnC family transcriptional regulator [Burkholderiaceae bacterium]